MSSFWQDLGVEPIEAKGQPPITNQTTNGGFWEQLGIEPTEKQKETPIEEDEEFLKRKLRKPGAFVKGTAKGIAGVPRLMQTLPIGLANLLTPPDAPWKEALEQKLQSIEKTPLEETISKRLESKFETRPEEEKFEKGGVRFGESIGMGIDPIASLLGAGAGQITEELGGGPGAQTVAELLGFSVPSITKAIAKGTTKEVVKGASGLPKLAGEGKKGGLIIAPKITPRRFRKLKAKYLDEASKSLKEIESKAFPEKELIKESDSMMDYVTKSSKEIDQVFPGADIARRVEDKATSLKKGITPSAENRTAASILNKREFDLARRDLVTTEELVKQFRTNNADVKILYEKLNLSEIDKGKIKGFKEYNNVIKDVFKEDLVGNKEFKDLFEKSNYLYHQKKNLEKFNNFVNTFTEDGKINAAQFVNRMKKPNNLLRLRKYIGKENANKMFTLSKDLGKIRLTLNDLNKFNKLPRTRQFMEYILPGAHFIPGVGPLAAKIAVGREVMNRILGIMYSSPAKARKFNNFTKLLRENKIPQAIKVGSEIEEMLKDSKYINDLVEES